jgi:hypothetical protein
MNLPCWAVVAGGAIPAVPFPSWSEHMRSACLLIAPLFAILLAWTAQGGGDKKKKEPAPAEKKVKLSVLPHAAEKEVQLVDWRFVQGTRHFSLDGDKIDPKTKKSAAPEYLEFREEKSTTYKNGIFTLIPLTSIRKITYDRDKKTVAVAVVTDAAEDVVVNGSTKFKGTNKVTIEAEEILKGLGAATKKYEGGVDKGLQSITFADPKPVEKAKGHAAVVTADDKEKSKHAATDVQPLYLSEGAYRTAPFLMFKKTVKIDMDKIASVRFVPSESKKQSSDYEVTLKDGVKHTLSLLTTVESDGKKSMTLVGLIGRVPVGYKLFSLDAIYEYRTGDDEEKK